MSFIDKLFSSKIVEPVTAVGNVLDNLFTSDDERLSHEEIKLRLQQQPLMAQNETNKIQATHRSRFVAGARPFIMWVCGFGLMMAFVVNPLIEFFTDGEKLINVPLDAMMELVLGLLGLGAMRTVEKIKGVAK